MIDKLIRAARRCAANYTVHAIPGDLVGDPCRTVPTIETDTEAFAELVEATREYFHAGRSPSSCRYCGAPLIWCKTPAGKKAPLDAVPIEGLDTNGEHRRIYLSHFATCPHADQVRQQRAGDDGKTKAGR